MDNELRICPEDNPPPRHYVIRAYDDEERGPFRTLEDAQAYREQWLKQIRIRRKFWEPYERAWGTRGLKKLRHIPKAKRDPKWIKQIRSELEGFVPLKPSLSPRDLVEGDCWRQFWHGTVNPEMVTAWQIDTHRKGNAFRQASMARKRQPHATKLAREAKKRLKADTDEAIRREWELEASKGTPWIKRARNVAETLKLTEQRVRTTTKKLRKLR